MEPALPGRVAAYFDAPDPARFDDLALAAYAFQVRHGAAQARLAARRGIDPNRLTHWRQIPPVPAAAYKAADLGLTGWPAQAIFRSSGTTAAERSVHAHPFLEIYRKTLDLTFPGACLPDGGRGRTPILALVPRPAALPDSSLSFMADHVIARWGTPESTWALAPGGVDRPATRAFVAAAGDLPVLVFTTAFALADLLDGLANERLRLPEGSVIMETGGFKGRRKEIARTDLLAQVDDRLAVPPNRVVREYGMSELTSQLYTRALAGGDPEVFFPSPWMRVHTLDPTTFEDTAPTTPGLVAFLDLANLSSAVHLVTEDWGTLTPAGGLVLHGRAPGAELRGCSLTAEEMVGN